MNRIGQKFKELRQYKRKGFIPFITAGDPDIETSKQIVIGLARLGADIIELGIPFTDPMADGPTIQASSKRALEQRINLHKILQMVKEIRLETDTPIVLFSYLNPILKFGYQQFSEKASEAGVDGLLVTDAVDHTALEIASILRANGLDLISLVAPTTSDKRLKTITANAGGFIYAVSRVGITGVQNETSKSAQVLVERIRAYTDLPIAVGFGISTQTQIEETWEYADAAVVGSAIVEEIERSLGHIDLVKQVVQFTKTLVPPVAIRQTKT
ncbi:tryptophan synthase subunit alpha [Leptolyngbya sp. 7M]|uniref:tryptophan synthase subunit alpha n=1 Tax=Leptolyngbya sp. 7M TaxID=2812896 RepID=UPI001B8C3930|nr:tryptophan synthase subunit alpha [Leptolyngbya sp. 7M]QYO65494.1 tryptophan synthase subunit alpha [Leptolyngbya sp. 7M]